MSIPAYILAGGKSSRFGSDKARAMVAGQPLICHIAETLAGEITVVADRIGKYADLGLETIADLHPGMGPLGGLQTALHDAHERKRDRVLLVSCDLVGLRPEWIDTLLDVSADADIIAFRGEFWEPLCTLYSTRILYEVERRLRQGELSMQSLLHSVRTIALPRPADWAQANTPEELMPHAFKILVFGPLADAAGAPAVQVRSPTDHPTCAELRRTLQEQHPSLAPLLRPCRLAVNHAFVPDSRIISPGEELALIGFVSGG